MEVSLATRINDVSERQVTNDTQEIEKTVAKNREKIGILTPKLSLSSILLTMPTTTLFHNPMLYLIFNRHDGMHP